MGLIDVVIFSLVIIFALVIGYGLAYLHDRKEIRELSDMLVQLQDANNEIEEQLMEYENNHQKDVDEQNVRINEFFEKDKRTNELVKLVLSKYGDSLNTRENGGKNEI